MDKIIQQIGEASEAAHKKMESDLGHGRILCSLGYLSKRCYKASEEARSKLSSTAIMIGCMFTGFGMPGFILGKSYPHVTEAIAFFGVIFSVAYYTTKKRSILKNSRVIILERRPIWLYSDKLAEETTFKIKSILLAMSILMLSVIAYMIDDLIKLGYVLFPIVLIAAFLMVLIFTVVYAKLFFLGLKSYFMGKFG